LILYLDKHVKLKRPSGTFEFFEALRRVLPTTPRCGKSTPIFSNQ
jgi:hypothetical protein